MKKYLSFLFIAITLVSTASYGQHQQTPFLYETIKKTGIFSGAKYTDSTKKISFADSVSVANDSTINGTGVGGSPLSVARALPPFVVADSLKTVRINAAGTGIEYAAAGAASKVYGETPGGAVNGTNDDFTLAFTPVAGTVRPYINGQRQSPAGFSVAASTVTFTVPPLTGDVIIIDYDR